MSKSLKDQVREYYDESQVSDEDLNRAIGRERQRLYRQGHGANATFFSVVDYLRTNKMVKDRKPDREEPDQDSDRNPFKSLDTDMKDHKIE